MNAGTAVGNSMKQGRDQARLERTPSIDVVITSDKSKWTRCPVVEMTDEIALSWNGSTDKSFGNKNHLLIKMVRFLEMMVTMLVKVN